MDLKTQVLEEFNNLKEEINQSINLVDASANNHLQNYLYFIHYPLFSFTESIIILCRNGKSHPAKVLLRSLFEAHINIIYHQISNSDYKLAVSAKDGFDSRLTQVREIKDIIRRYPHLKSKGPTDLFSEERVQELETLLEREIRAITRGSGLNGNERDMDLKAKAIKCDQANLENVTQGHFERMYTLIYRHLSPQSHLNIDGIQTFLDKQEDGRYLFNDGDDGDFIMGEAIQICLAFVKDLYDNEVIKGVVPAAVSRMENMLKRGL